MNQDQLNQEWLQLESRINKMVSRLLRDDIPAIEHKPLNTRLLLSVPTINNEQAEESL